MLTNKIQDNMKLLLFILSAMAFILALVGVIAHAVLGHLHGVCQWLFALLMLWLVWNLVRLSWVEMRPEKER